MPPAEKARGKTKTDGAGSAKGRTLPDGKVTKLIPSGVDGTALEVSVHDKPRSTRRAQAEHAIRLCSFNSGKLRDGKSGATEQWLGLLATMSVFDVVLVQGVDAAAEPTAGGDAPPEGGLSGVIKMLLEHHSGDAWELLQSAVSANGKRHEVFVRHPIRVVRAFDGVDEPAEGGNAAAEWAEVTPASLGCASFSVHLADDRFREKEDRDWIVTTFDLAADVEPDAGGSHVHSFVDAYLRNSQWRVLGEPRRPFRHLLVGDWREHRDDFGNGALLPALGERLSTSPGARSHDNFFVDSTTCERMTQSSELLELDVADEPSEGAAADHHPIAVKLSERPAAPSGETGVLC